MRVLLVDDDPASHVLVTDLLSDEGHTVDLAEDPETAQAYVRHIASEAGPLACGAVILDFHLDGGNSTLSGQNAHSVLDTIREVLGEDFPVIGFSGRPMDTHRISNLHADPTKDGWLQLPGLLAGIERGSDL